MSLPQCMRGHTDFQIRVWLAWLDKQLNNPDLVCHYLMSVICELRNIQQMFNKRRKKIKLLDAKIPFKEGKPKRKRVQKKRGKGPKLARMNEQDLAASKSIWQAIVGGKVIRKIKYPDGRIVDVTEN
jgi:hypothetical protein